MSRQNGTSVWKNPIARLSMDNGKTVKTIKGLAPAFLHALDNCVRAYVMGGPASVFNKTFQDDLGALASGMELLKDFEKGTLFLYYPANDEEAESGNFTAPMVSIPLIDVHTIIKAGAEVGPMIKEWTERKAQTAAKFLVVGEDLRPEAPAKPGKARTSKPSVITLED